MNPIVETATGPTNFSTLTSGLSSTINGFPMWAILLIIIVLAVALAIATGLLTHFIGKRNRQKMAQQNAAEYDDDNPFLRVIR